jgi:hypothetical protein
MRLQTPLAIATLALLPALASAQPTGLDGIIGADWAGYTATQVSYNSAAPESNFGSPTNQSDQTGYEIFLRRDTQYLYTAVRTTGGRNAGGLLFSNLYFSTRSGTGPYGNIGSSIGFEVTNDRAFAPGVPGYFNDTPSDLIRVATSSVGGVDVIESAISLSAFTSNALGVTGYAPPTSPVGIRLNLSQSFGYSVAGGADSYGDARLGFVSLATTVPEPSSYALMFAGLAAVGMVARKRRDARV